MITQMNNYRFHGKLQLQSSLNLPQVEGDQELREKYQFAYYSCRGVYAQKWDNVYLQPVLNCRSHHSASHKASKCNYSSLPCKYEQQNTKIFSPSSSMFSILKTNTLSNISKHKIHFINLSSSLVVRILKKIRWPPLCLSGSRTLGQPHFLSFFLAFIYLLFFYKLDFTSVWFLK